MDQKKKMEFSKCAEIFVIYQNPTRKVADEGTEATEGAAAPNILVAGLMILVRVVLFGPARFFLILANFECSNKK